VRPSSSALALLTVAFAGCNTNLAVDPEGLKCDVGNVCPQGFLCEQGECRRQPVCPPEGCQATCSQSTDCTEPPVNSCVSPTALRAYDAVGSCTDGACQYGYADVSCAGGCELGACVGDPCAGLSCTTPPAAVCVSATTLQTSSLPGTCTAGACGYLTKDITCTNGCEAGACKDQDLCAGVVCDDPPKTTCVGGKIRTYQSVGTCAQGTGLCSYTFSETECAGICTGSTCKPGFTFAQTLPAVRHAITAIDQAPSSNGGHVLAIGPGGKVSQWSSSKWTELASPTTQRLNALWLASDTAGWLVGENKTVLHYDGTGLSVVNLPGGPATANLVGVHGSSASHVLIADSEGNYWRLRSGSWTHHAFLSTVAHQMTSVFVSAANRERIAGSCGTPFKGCVVDILNDVEYEDVDVSETSFRAVGPSVDPAADDNAFVGVASAANVRRYLSNGDFDDLNVPAPLDGDFVTAISNAKVTAGQGVYVLTGSATPGVPAQLYRFTNSGFNPSDALLSLTLSTAPGGRASMSRNESSGVIVADSGPAGGTILRRGQGTYGVLDVGEHWQDVEYGPDGRLALMNVDGDLAMRPLGQPGFSFTRSPGLPMRAMAVRTTSVLTVGAAGEAFVFDGSDFVPVSSGTAQTLNDVCRATDTELYAVGDAGAVLRFDGSSFVAETSGTAQNLRTVSCAAAQSAVACGDNGAIVRRTASGWVPVSPAFPTPSKSIASCVLTSSGAVYVAGDGFFARLENGVWSNLPGQPKLAGLQVVDSNEVYAISSSAVVRFNGFGWASLLVAPYALSASAKVADAATFVGASGVVVEGTSN
jgi:hypothetical protein